MPFLEQAVITVGTFDGVHIAHRAILDKVLKSAKTINGMSTVISFASHPRRVIDPDFKLNILTSTEEKNKILQEIGIDTILYIDFTSAIAQTHYTEFIESLSAKIDIKKIVVGYDHNFGKNREGNIDNLRKLIPVYGFDVVEVPQQTIDGIEISSSSIRKAINNGNIKLANKLLGYDYLIETCISSFHEDYLIVNPINKDKILPPKGKYEIIIDNKNTFLEINNDLCILNKNRLLSDIDEKERNITITFLNQHI